MKIYLASCGDDSGGFSLYLQGKMKAMLFSFYDLTDSWAPFRKRAFKKIMEDKNENKERKTVKHIGERKGRYC